MIQFKNKLFTDYFLLSYVIPCIIVIGISVILFVKATTMVFSGNDTRATFYALTEGMENYYEFKIAWRPRLFSTSLAALTVYISETFFEKESILSAQNSLEMTVGLWTAGWFLLISLVLIYFLKKRSLFYIFGLFSAISFGYMDIARTNLALRLYPWDLPSLFFFTLFTLLFIQKKYTWLLFIIPLGVGFKESMMALCFGLLFIEQPIKNKMQMFLIALGFSLGVKLSLDVITQAPLFFTMETEAEQKFLTHNLSSLKATVPFFINAGTLLSFFILPSMGYKNIVALKALAVLFIFGNLFFGILTEYRIWLEVTPFALYAFDVRIYGNHPE